MLSSTAPAWPRLLPVPVSLVAAVLWLWTAGSRARFAGGLAAALLAAALARDAGLHRRIDPSDRPTFRIVQWTLATGIAGDRLLSELDRERPHVVVFHHPPENLATLRQLDIARRLRLNFAIRRDAILVISRFPMDPLTPPQFGAIETIFLRVNDPAGAVYLLALDAEGETLGAPQVRALEEFIRTHPEARPLILACGNARERTDAVWRPLRRLMQPAYEKAGFGWPYSYPARLPLYGRDHLWMSGEWTAHGVGYRWSRHATHLRHFAILSRADSR